MKYRSYRKKRTYAKRRRTTKFWSKKRTFNRKFARADGYHKEKISYQDMLTVQNNTASYYVNWLKPRDLAPAAAQGVYQSVTGTNNQNLQFAQCYGMYREFRVKGLKIEFRPTITQPGTVDISYRPIQVGTAMNTTGNNPGLPAISGALDYKEYSPQRPWKRYYHVSRWAKSTAQYGGGWQRCANYMTAGFPNTPTNDCVTAILCPSIYGLANNSVIGDLKITYYCDFRSRQPDAGGQEFQDLYAHVVDQLNQQE